MAVTQIRGEQVKDASVDSDQVAITTIDTTHIDWGTGVTGVNAGDIPFESGHTYGGSASNVMDALEEILLGTSIVINETPTGNIDSSNVTFTLANTASTGTTDVYLNGVRLDEGDVSSGGDYQITGSTITMNEAPETGDKIRVGYLK